MAVESVEPAASREPDTIEMPAPTAWPIVLAFGITLLFAGLVTSEAVSVLGAIVAIAGAVGWFRDVLPHEAHESVHGDAASRRPSRRRGAKSPEWRSRTNCSGRGCRWRSIRFRRASRAVWPEAWPWRFWRCFTVC